MGEILAKEPQFEWLEPPLPNGRITVLDVLTATNLIEHEIKVRTWAGDVWSGWYSKHNETINNLVHDNYWRYSNKVVINNGNDNNL